MARRLGTAALWMAMMWALLACSAPDRWTDGRPDIYAPPPARPLSLTRYRCSRASESARRTRILPGSR